MVTILLEKIIALLTGFFGDFIEWANTVGDKIASIKDNTDSLPDIKDNTDSIAADTPYIKSAVQNLNTWASNIYNRVNGIEQKTDIIKNNSGSIATSSGTAAAFAEDIANNTLDMDSRLVTIGSDTTQIRADSGNLAADVAEIKDTLGLYLYNTIVTEDAEGDIASWDTDLKDYLTEAKVTIPADAGGVSECKIGYVDFNQLLEISRIGASSVVSDVTITNNGDGSININGTASANILKNIALIGMFHQNHVYYLGSGSKCTFSDGYGDGVNIVKWNRADNNANLYLRITNGTQVNEKVYLMCFDLTQMFGSTIADYIYSLEQNTAKMGVDLIRAIFNKIYYSYNVGGSLVSVQSVNGSYYPNAVISFGSSITEGGELDLVTGLLRVDTTPVTYIQTTPAPIRTLKGLNSIWADYGDISVTYRETLKHYLKKQEA